MSSTVNGYMQALLALTGNSDLEQARNMLLRSMSDQDLVKLVIQVVSQNFPRDGLEEIALRITDIIKHGVFESPLPRRFGLLVEVAPEQLQHISAPTRLGSLPWMNKVKEETTMEGDETEIPYEILYLRKSPGIVLWCPKNADSGMWCSLRLLPITLRTAINRKIKQDFLSPESRMTKFERFLRECDRDLSIGLCANKAIDFYPPGNPLCDYKKALGNSYRSCDSCTESHKLCLRPVEVDGKNKLALFPLSAVFRKARNWKDMQFWVQD